MTQQAHTPLPKMFVDSQRPGIIRWEGGDELTGIIAGIKAPEIVRAVNNYDALVDAIKLILPMAKGYAHANQVGGNQRKIESVEALLEQAEGK